MSTNTCIDTSRVNISKKKRGKQRKAAKLAAASRAGDGRMQTNRFQQQSELDWSSAGDGMQEINRSEPRQ